MSELVEASNPIHIDIIDDRGNSFISKNVEKTNKMKLMYIKAERRKRFSLRVKNLSNKYIGIVISIDGYNIIEGKKSWLRSNEKMYILDPYEIATYQGWRTGKNRVNRFFFTSSKNSYASALGNKSSMGEIALAVFNGEFRDVDSYSESSYSNRSYGDGREEYSPSVKVSFRPKNNPTMKYLYKYGWNSPDVASNMRALEKMKKDLNDLKRKLKTEKVGETSLHWSD